MEKLNDVLFKLRVAIETKSFVWIEIEGSLYEYTPTTLKYWYDGRDWKYSVKLLDKSKNSAISVLLESIIFDNKNCEEK